MREYLGGRPPKDPNSFWDNVVIRGKDDCWIYKSKSKTYPSFRGKHVHRIVAEIKYGEIPKFNDDGMKIVVRHSCNNKQCVNPNHIRLGTVQQNAFDMWRENKALNKDEVIEIRKLRDSGMTYLSISKLFNHNPNTIRNAYLGKGTYGEIVY